MFLDLNSLNTFWYKTVVWETIWTPNMYNFINSDNNNEEFWKKMLNAVVLI